MLPAAKSDHDSTIASRQQHHRHSLSDLVLSEPPVAGKNYQICNHMQKEKDTVKTCFSRK